jgi:hypothetical protein
LGVGWNFLIVGGCALLATTHPAERGTVQGINELVIFTTVAAGSLLAGALLHCVRLGHPEPADAPAVDRDGDRHPAMASAAADTP